MKVKCINIFNEHNQQYQNESSWLKIGSEYIVLEIMTSAKKGLLYRMVGNNQNQMPAVYAASQFEIISELIPSNWHTSIINKSLIILGPKSWRKNDFWDACYDGDPAALEIYKREARIIYEEEGML